MHTVNLTFKRDSAAEYVQVNERELDENDEVYIVLNVTQAALLIEDLAQQIAGATYEEDA